MSKLVAFKQGLIDRRYKRFGIFIINHYKLEDNILLIKYPNSFAPVPKLRSTKISNEFKNLLINMLDTGSINVELQKKIRINEIDIFDTLMKLSQLKDPLNYKRIEQSLENTIHRFYILRSELFAGNDSEILKAELINVINVLNSKGKIGDEDATELISILVEKK